MLSFSGREPKLVRFKGSYSLECFRPYWDLHSFPVNWARTCPASDANLNLIYCAFQRPVGYCGVVLFLSLLHNHCFPLLPPAYFGFDDLLPPSCILRPCHLVLFQKLYVGFWFCYLVSLTIFVWRFRKIQTLTASDTISLGLTFYILTQDCFPIPAQSFQIIPLLSSQTLNSKLLVINLNCRNGYGENTITKKSHWRRGGWDSI